MSMYSEHRRMKPVMDKARDYDIAEDPRPEAIFEAGSSGFQVWCTPEDHPEGWEGVSMFAGAFSKPCEFVGGAYWHWNGETIVAVAVDTDAYALRDQKKLKDIHNRPEDIEWIKGKIEWLFNKAGVPMLPIKVELKG